MAELSYGTMETESVYMRAWHRVSGEVCDAVQTWKQRVPAKQLLLVTSQLALMLETGNTISESLDALGNQMEGLKIGGVLKNVSGAVASGKTLTASLAEHPAVFPPVLVSAVKAGEASGQLARVFKQVEVHLTKRTELRESIRSALTYPAILTVLLLGVVIFAVTFVLPRFTMIFQKSGVVLPLPTRILMTAAMVTRRHWYLIPVVLLLGPSAFYLLVRTPKGRIMWDRVLLGVPIVGSLAKSISTSTLARTLGMLFESGVPMMDSIEVAKDSVGSHQFRQFLGGVARSVLQGEGFSAPFRNSDLMSPVDKQMVQTGERTASLPRVMKHLADYHGKQVDQKIRRLTALMEPFFIALMGLFVGFIAMAVLLPLFKMASAMKGGG